MRKISGAHAPGMPGTFSSPPRVSDPDIHHGMCVTHSPWCMPGSLTSGFDGGGNVPGIPGVCATRNFTHLDRGPWTEVPYTQPPSSPYQIFEKIHQNPYRKYVPLEIITITDVPNFAYEINIRCSKRETYSFNSGQNERHFTGDFFRCILVNEKFFILIKTALEFVPKGPINYNSALV